MSATPNIPDDGYDLANLPADCDHRAPLYPGARVPSPCPAHFTSICTSMANWAGRVVHGLVDSEGQPDGLVDGYCHLMAHGWVPPALYTWASLFGQYACPPGVPLSAALDGMRFATLDDGEAAPVTLAALKETLAAALGGDPQDMLSALKKMGEHGPEERLGMAGSLMLSAAKALPGHPDATENTWSLFHTFGSQVAWPNDWRLLPVLARLGDTLVAGDEVGTGAALLALDSLDRKHQAAALLMAARTLMHAIETTAGPLPIVQDGELAGVLDWEQPDAAHGEAHLPMVWALRAARAVAGPGDGPGRLVELLRSQPDPRQFVRAATLRAVEYVSGQVDAAPAADDPPAPSGPLG